MPGCLALTTRQPLNGATMVITSIRASISRTHTIKNNEIPAAITHVPEASRVESAHVDKTRMRMPAMGCVVFMWVITSAWDAVVVQWCRRPAANGHRGVRGLPGSDPLGPRPRDGRAN